MSIHALNIEMLNCVTKFPFKSVRNFFHTWTSGRWLIHKEPINYTGFMYIYLKSATSGDLDVLDGHSWPQLR